MRGGGVLILSRGGLIANRPIEPAACAKMTKRDVPEFCVALKGGKQGWLESEVKPVEWM